MVLRVTQEGQGLARFCLTFRTTASREWMVGVTEVILSLVTGCCSRSFEDPRVGEAEAELCISNF